MATFEFDFEIDPRIAFAETLPSRCYCSQEVYHLEQDRIFASSWQLVGRLASLPSPGSFFTATVAGEPLLLLRSLEGTVRAFYNLCRHRAGPLVIGSGQCERLRCGYHGWTYDLNGRLIGVPDFEGVANFCPNDNGLEEVEVGIWESFLFVRLLPVGPNLPDLLEEIPRRMSPSRIGEMEWVARRDYVIECNWKVYVDNYVEGYHIPIVHPSLLLEIDYSRYRTLPARYASLQDAPIRTGSEAGGSYLPTSNQSEMLYYWIFPNLMLNLHPDNLSTNLILPLGPTRTLTIFEWYAHDPDREGFRDRVEEIVQVSDQIQQEDIRICEAVQQRLGSRAYQRGRYSPRRENGLHHFHQLWSEWMRRPEGGEEQ
jgi:choline monooxygenase